MVREKGVDALSISLEPLLRPRRQGGKAARGFSIEAYGANELVDRQKVGAADFGHASLTDPAQDVHLKHPLARMQIAERARRVVQRASEDVRHAIGVAPYASFGGETGEPFGSRMGGHGAIEEVEARERGEDDERENQTRRPFNQTPSHPCSRAPRFWRRSNLPGSLESVPLGADGYNSKLTITGAWSEGRSHPRASRRTCIPFTESPRAGLTQIWSSRRPLLAFCQSGER